MKSYIVHDVTGAIVKTGHCPAKLVKAQARDGEFVIEGIADDRTQKIIGGKVVEKTPAEILADNLPPPVIADEDRPANITKKELTALMKRVQDLENS
ncbi:MAG TPA: hypothetical protein ENH62_13060 [Marinobacter sp.]|nr:hypothetical protein [Marinobacter sp.]